LLLDRLTLTGPLGEAELSFTVHVSVAVPVMLALAQEKLLTAGLPPNPLRLITAVLAVEELLVIVSCPVAAPGTVGSNCNVSVVCWPGFNVSGNVAPDTVNPAPVNVAALTVTGSDPVEAKVKGWVAIVFSGTASKARFVVLICNVEAYGYSFIP
jgi:hypothetical protein